MDDTKTHTNLKIEAETMLLSNNKTVAVRYIVSAIQKGKNGKVSPLKLQVLQV